jgi:copper chaperone NosL
MAPLRELLKREFKFLARPLNLTSRLLLLAGVVALMLSYWFPLWEIKLVAPQYQEGLTLDIHSWRIVAGNKGNDIHEINNLNHYIGMKPLHEADFHEMKWMPFLIGVFVIYTLRAAVFGMMRYVIDLLVLFSYFGAFSLASFVYRMWSYGHNLDPKAPMTIEPFTPVIFGTQQIANFTQSSLPQGGTYLLTLYVLCLVLAIWFSRKETI